MLDDGIHSQAANRSLVTRVVVVERSNYNQSLSSCMLYRRGEAISILQIPRMASSLVVAHSTHFSVDVCLGLEIGA